MIVEVQHPLLEPLLASGRVDDTGRILPDEDEIKLLYKLSQESSYFRGVFQELQNTGMIPIKSFVYLMEAMNEVPFRLAAQKKCRTIKDLPAIGEQVRLKVCVAVLKDIPWASPSNSGMAKPRFSLGVIAYSGETEIFFWGISQLIIRAHLEPQQCYYVTGVVKNVKPTMNKIELTRISKVELA